MDSRKPTLILSFTLLVVMVGYSMILPIMPFYIEKLGAGGREMGWLMAVYSLMQLIFAPVWGVISDRVGRKPVLIIGVLGYAITLFLFGLANALWMLFLARILSGVLSSATMPTTMAYIADTAPENERSARMAQLSAAMGVGMVVGPLLSGLLSTRSLSLPFFAGSALAFGAFLLVVFVLPTPQKAAGAKAQSEKRPGLDRSAALEILRSPAGLLLLPIFIISFGLTSFQGITGLFVVDKFAFDTRQVASMWMVMGAMMVAAPVLLTGPLTKRFGELWIIRTGLIGGALGFVLMTRTVDYLTTLLALGFFTLTLGLVGPALNGFLSRFAGERQGTVMGLNSAATSLGRVIGPVWAGYLYEVNIVYPYFSGSVTLLLGVLVLVLGLRSAVRRETVALGPAPEAALEPKAESAR